jgi:hypothetical protein
MDKPGTETTTPSAPGRHRADREYALAKLVDLAERAGGTVERDRDGNPASIGIPGFATVLFTEFPDGRRFLSVVCRGDLDLGIALMLRALAAAVEHGSAGQDA